MYGVQNSNHHHPNEWVITTQFKIVVVGLTLPEAYCSRHWLITSSPIMLSVFNSHTSSCSNSWRLYWERAGLHSSFPSAHSRSLSCRYTCCSLTESLYTCSSNSSTIYVWSAVLYEQYLITSCTSGLCMFQKWHDVILEPVKSVVLSLGWE